MTSIGFFWSISHYTNSKISVREIAASLERSITVVLIMIEYLTDFKIKLVIANFTVIIYEKHPQLSALKLTQLRKLWIQLWSLESFSQAHNTV